MVKQKISVYGAVVKENKVLLLHRIKPDVWEFPGGRIEYGEHPSDTAKREVEEETSLKVRIDGILGVGSIVRPDEMHEVVIVYKCVPKNGKVGLSPEHSESKFMSIQEIEKIENLATSVKSVMDVLRKCLGE